MGIKLEWDNLGNYQKKIKDMIGILKKDNLPVILWGDATERLWRPLFDVNGIKISAMCDIASRGVLGDTDIET